MIRDSGKLSLLLSFALAAAQAAGPVATIRSSGTVTVGGAELRAEGVPSWPVVSGDRIATGADGVAIVSSPQLGRLEIRANSEVALAEDHIVLEKGVVGSNRLPIRLSDYTVRSEDESGQAHWFVVARRDGKPVVAAHRGGVIIQAEGSVALLVPAGSYASPAPLPEQKNDEDDDDDEKKPAATAGAATAGWTLGALTHAQSIALVAGIGAAAATGATVGLSGAEEAPQVVRSPGTQ